MNLKRSRESSSEDMPSPSKKHVRLICCLRGARATLTMYTKQVLENLRVNGPPASATTHDTTAVLTFLQGLEPNMERLHAKFEEAKFDDVMLHTISAWSDEEIDEYLGDLVKLGLLGIAQRFIVKRGLVRMRTISSA